MSLLCDVIDQKSASSTAIITPRHRTKSFLPGSIPQLQLQAFPSRTSANFDNLVCELDANGMTTQTFPFITDKPM
jgi:hypothetical protein